MKENNKKFKKVKKFFRRFINGKKGAVSLFMAFLMTPIMSISLMLVETARYQNVIQLMNEIVDVSAFSELANFDPYLQKRFGLFSISQKMDITTKFNEYLAENAKAAGNSVTINSATVNGAYALSDSDILKQQLIESGEISVLTEVVYNGLNVDDLIKKLSKEMNIDELKKTTDAISNTAEGLSEAVDIVNSLKELMNQYEKYKTAIKDYSEKYSAFLISIIGDSDNVGIVSAINNAVSNLEEDEDYDAIYEKSEVKTAAETFNTAKDNYKNAASTLKSEYKGFVDKVKGIKSTAEKLYKKLANKDGNDESEDKDATDVLSDNISKVIETLYNNIDSICNASFLDEVDKKCTEIQNQINALGDLNEKDIDSSWDEDKVSSDYGVISVNMFEDLVKAIQNAIDVFDGNIDDDDNTLDAKDTVDLFLNIFGTVFSLSGIYDGNLDAVVNSSYLLNDEEMNASAMFVIQSLGSLSDACDKLYNSWTNKNVIIKVINIISGIADLLKALVNFLGAVITWAGELIDGIVTFALKPSEWYNNLILYGYGVYNMPNRLNYSSGKTISGYSYSAIYENAGGTNMPKTLMGSLKEFGDIGNQIGDSKMFKGAEAEYLLIGSNSELLNQSVSFIYIYLFRLLLDIGPVLKNKELNGIALMAGPLAWLVKVVVILAEPIVDTLFIVNGKSEYMFKNTIYLSYSGMLEVQKKLIDISNISDDLKDKIKKYVDNHNGISPYKGSFEMDYKEHLLLLTICYVKQYKYLKRMQNLIQMETYVACEKDSPGTNFKLDKAYTFMQTDVTYTLQPLFAIDSLTKNGYFTKNRKQYFGY